MYVYLYTCVSAYNDTKAHLDYVGFRCFSKFLGVVA